MKAESLRHGDILQDNFQDTYNNLTLKSMFALKYAEEFVTERADWVMLVDDDSYVNIPALLEFLNQTVSKDEGRDYIIGKVGYGNFLFFDINHIMQPFRP